MRRSTCSLAVVVILSVCFARVEADNDQSNYTFFGIMVGKMDFSRDAVAESAEPLVVTGRVGRDFNQFLGVELRGGTTLDEDELSDGTKIDVNYFGAGLARFGLLPTRERRYGIYGIAGYSYADIETKLTNGVSPDASDSGLSWGVGVDLFANERSGLNFEYMRYLDTEKDDVSYKLEHIGIGYVRRF